MQAAGNEPIYARDAELVRACLAGDDESWKVLIRRYHALIYSIPRRYGLREEDAADVYQTVCLALWKGLPSLRSEKALTAWIQSTARRQSERLAARRRREPSGDEESALTLADDRPDALNEISRAEEEHRVRKALARLPERCARLLARLYLSEPMPSYDAVAQELGIPRGSIGPTRARCLEKLKSLLE